MDEIPSTEFRKTYATRTKQCFVTVNGHIIGHWIPEGSATYVAARTEVFGLIAPPGAATRDPAEGDPLFRGGAMKLDTTSVIQRGGPPLEPVRPPDMPGHEFRTRPFTPVPKKPAHG